MQVQLGDPIPFPEIFEHLLERLSLTKESLGLGRRQTDMRTPCKISKIIGIESRHAKLIRESCPLHLPAGVTARTGYTASLQESPPGVGLGAANTLQAELIATTSYYSQAKPYQLQKHVSKHNMQGVWPH